MNFDQNKNFTDFSVKPLITYLKSECNNLDYLEIKIQNSGISYQIATLLQKELIGSKDN